MSVFFKVGLDICKANTNTSTAKYQYSFSKAERFPGTKLKTKEQKEKEKEEEERRKQEEQERIRQKKYIKHDYYLLPSTLSTRKTNFGFGERTDFTGCSKKNKSKTSESQEVKPLTKEEKLKRMNQFAEYEFERKYYHGPKYSIPEAGKGKKKEEKKDENKDDKEAKEERKKEEENKKDPVGPGRYNIVKSFGSEAPKYSIKGIPDKKIEEMKKEVKKKREEYEEKERQNKRPVPPHEEQVTIQIRKNGKYAISQIPNVNSFKIEKPDKYKNEIYKKLGKNKEEDEDKEKNKENVKFVDPLLAKQVDRKAVKKSLDSLMGVNFPSKYQTREPITFGLRHDVKSSMDNIPGPGSYIIPSEFGIYLSKDYNDPNKYPQENVYVEPKKEQDPRPWRHGMKIIKAKEEEDEGYGDQEEEQKEEPKEEPKQEEVTPTPIEEKKEEQKEEEKKEEKKEEDKESECIMLRDILQYQS